MSILSAILEPRSLENPTTSLADPDEWLYDALGGGKSDSGIRVNSETALTYAAVWRAVNLVAGSVAKLPCVLYRRSGVGKERAADHPAYRLLKHKASPGMHVFFFKFALMLWALLRGNGYAYIVRRGDGAPVELLPMSAAVTYPVRLNGVLFYRSRVNNQDKNIPAENVFHLRGLTKDGIEGISTITKARESLGLGMAAHKYGRIFFANNARPDVVLKHPGVLSDTASKRLSTSWSAAHGGLDKSHRPAVVEEGTEVTLLSMSNEDAQFLQTRKFEIREVANWFGVPAHKLGDDAKTSHASLEQENQSYLDEALDPWLVAFESEAWDKLLTRKEQDQDSHVIEFLRQALVRANLQARGIYYRTAVMGGWMSPDEVRSRENQNPIPDGLGDIYFRPLNMAIAGEEPAPEPPPPEPPPPEPPPPEPEPDPDADAASLDAHRRALAAVLVRMCRRLNTHADKARKRQDLKPWLAERMERDHRPVIIAALEPSLAAAAAACGPCPDAAHAADALLEQARSSLAKRALADSDAAALAAALLSPTQEA